MQYRSIGASGLQISEIGFGCADPSGLMTKGSFDEQVRVIARAVELGVNYFDIAPDYGNPGGQGEGVSEANLGKVLKELGLRPVLTTKVEVRAENLSDIAGHIQFSVEQSLKRLGVDYVDIVQIHNGPTTRRPQFEGRGYQFLSLEDYYAPNGALEGLTRLQRAGKARFLGFICRGNDKQPVRELLDTGLFQMINVSYTLLNPTAGMPKPYGMEVDQDFGEVLSYAHGNGVGTAIYSPLSGGLLADQIIHRGEFHPLARTLIDRQRPLLTRAQAFAFLSTTEHSLAQAAIRFILMAPGATTVLSGVSDIAQLEEVAETSGAGPLSPELMSRVEMVWRTWQAEKERET